MAFLDEAGLAVLWNLICNKHDGIANEYIWAKRLIEYSAAYDSVKQHTQQNNTTQFFAGETETVFYVANDFNSLVLNGGEELRINTSNSNVNCKQLNGKYFRKFYSATNKLSTSVFFVPSNATWSIYGLGWATATATEYVNARKQRTVLSTDYVTAATPDAYPPEESDGYEYTQYGRIGEKSVIESGTYVGTGTYGASNQNSLTFPYPPKLVIVWCPNASSSGGYNGVTNPMLLAHGYNGITEVSDSAWGGITATWDGNTVSWYAVNAETQKNASGKTYYYVAFY